MRRSPASTCWNPLGTYSYDNRSNVVDVYIGYLRQKVDRPFATNNIETVRGFGYRLRTEET